MAVPACGSAITGAWLSAALAKPVSITGVVRIGERYGLASEVHLVELDGFDAGSVVVKCWSIDSTAGTTEVDFYNDLAPDVDGLVPVAHHAGHHDGHGVLVLAHLDGRQGDVLVRESFDSLRRIAARLGLLHSRWWGNTSLGNLAWLRDGRRQERTHDWLASRSTKFVERFGSPTSSLAASLLANAPRALMVGNTRLTELPATLVHGDLHLDNILFVDGRPMLLDWAGCRRGPGAQDLVNVLFGMDGADHVDSLLETYLGSLVDAGADVDRGGLERGVGGAVLWAFVFWTLGTAIWEPNDARSEAMQRKSITDAAAMVEFWMGRDASLFEQVLG